MRIVGVGFAGLQLLHRICAVSISRSRVGDGELDDREPVMWWRALPLTTEMQTSSSSTPATGGLTPRHPKGCSNFFLLTRSSATPSLHLLDKRVVLIELGSINYYQEGSHVYPELSAEEAYRKALQTWGRWVDTNIDHTRTKVFFRGYSSSHFR